MSERQSAVGALRDQIEAAQALVAELYPILENDDGLARDMVDGGTDLHDALRHGISRIVEIRALLTGIEETTRVLESRADAFEQQEARIRAAMMTAMEVGRLPRLETPLGTVSRRAVGPSLIVTDEAAIPYTYKIPQRPKLDKRAILAALKEGADVPGAELSNGGMTVALKLS